MDPDEVNIQLYTYHISEDFISGVCHYHKSICNCFQKKKRGFIGARALNRINMSAWLFKTNNIIT